MTRLLATIYDPFMARTERACLGEWRQEILGRCAGRVLEVGAGTGANLEHYPRVDSLTLAEPDPAMRSRLEARVARWGRPATVVDASVDALPFESGVFDTVVATLLLCSVTSPRTALAEIRRVLAPTGRFIFLEHVVAEGYPGRERLQRLIEPVWHPISGGCHVTRDTRAEIERAGFVFESFTRQSMRGAFPWLRPSIRGVCRAVGSEEFLRAQT